MCRRRKPDNLANVYQELMRDRPLAAFGALERFFEIEFFACIRELSEELARGHRALDGGA